MSDLDEKLRTILHKVIPREGEIEGMTNELHERCIEVTADKIHQAFEDEGYVHIPQVEVVTRYEAGKKPEVFMVNGKEVMTGQEWLSRYKTEKGQGSLDNLKDMPHSKDYSDGIDHAVIKCDEAAERASGIKEEQQNA